jgi:stage V sporulation protein G
LPQDSDGRAKLYADIAHPINSACREMIQDVVVREYDEELERAQDPNYVSRYDDFDMDYFEVKRPVAPSHNGTRVDPPHHRDGRSGEPNHAVNHRDSSAAHRGAAPPPKSASRPVTRSISDGFGAGILPGE